MNQQMYNYKPRLHKSCHQSSIEGYEWLLLCIAIIVWLGFDSLVDLINTFF